METPIPAGVVGPGEYAPAGERQGEYRTFSVGEVAEAFGVAAERIRRAMAGEFGLGPDGLVDSRQAQHLAEVILGDRPLAEQEAALMQLGAFTPRYDHVWGAGETPPEDESEDVQSSER